MGDPVRHPGPVDAGGPTKIVLRPGRTGDAPALSAIARAAKAHWDDSDALLALWTKDLTITPELIGRDSYRVAERDGRPVAFLALTREASVPSIEHLWVLPEAMGEGLGRRLLEDALAQCRRAGVAAIRIVADPNATGFYARFGALEIGSVASRPAPRRLPLLEIRLSAPVPEHGGAAASPEPGEPADSPDA